MTRVLLSSVSRDSTADLRSALAAAGFEVVDHPLGSSPTVEFDGIAAAVIAVADRVHDAVAQTKRWRLERGDDRMPVLWVLPVASDEPALAGLEAGADSCLACPVNPAVLTAQVLALARARAASARLAAKAAEARLLSAQLRKAYDRIDAEATLAGQVQRICLTQQMPRVGAVNFAICHRPRGCSSQDFFEARRLDETHVGIVLGSILGQGGTVSSLLTVFIHESIELKEISGRGYRLHEPDAVLARLNRQLLALGLEDPPLVAMFVALVDCRDGSISLARAGFSAPVLIPGEGHATAWGAPGPFLGTSEASFEATSGRLMTGDRLLIGSPGLRSKQDDRALSPPPDLLLAVDRHRGLEGQAFAEALTGELVSRSDSHEDFTLMVVQMREDESSRTPGLLKWPQAKP